MRGKKKKKKKSTVSTTDSRTTRPKICGNHLWALSLNHLASINNGMKVLAVSSIQKSGQHIDLGFSRLTQNNTD